MPTDDLILVGLPESNSDAAGAKAVTLSRYAFGFLDAPEVDFERFTMLCWTHAARYYDAASRCGMSSPWHLPSNGRVASPMALSPY